MLLDQESSLSPSLSREPEQPDPPQPSLPRLTPKEISRFKDLVTTTYNLARTYNGSSLKRDVFLNAVQALKDFAEPFRTQSGMNEDQLLASFAAHAQTVFSEGFSIQKMYDTAFANFLPTRQDRPTDVRALLQRLTPLKVDIETSKIELYITSNRETPTRIEYQPRLAMVLQVLFDKGLSAEDMTFMIYDTSSTVRLSNEHIIISIPERMCQIAVSDLMTRDIYVTRTIKPLEYWQSEITAELSQDPDVTVIKGISGESLYDAISAALPEKKNSSPQEVLGLDQSGGPATLSEIPLRLEAFLANRRQINAISSTASPHKDPLKRLFSDVQTPVRTPATVREKIKASIPFAEVPALKTPVLRPTQSPLEYIGASLKKRREFPSKLPDGTRAAEIWKPWVMEKISEYRATHDQQNPGRESGPVIGFEGIDWSMIDDALYDAGRGKKMRLTRFIEKNFPKPKKIRLPKQEKPPKVKKITTPRAEKKPLHIKVKTAKPAQPQNIQKITDERTINPLDQVLDHLRQNGQWLDTLADGQNARPLIAAWLAAQLRKTVSGPLAKHPDISWDMIAEAFTAQAQSVPAPALAPRPLSLAIPLDNHIGDIARTPFEQITASLIKTRKFPLRLADGQNATDTWRAWLIERINEYRNDHEQKNPTVASGPVKGCEPLDWAMIDQAIYAAGRHHRIRLDRFIEKNKSALGIKTQRRKRVSAPPVEKTKPVVLKGAPVDEDQNLSPLEKMLAYVAINRKLPPGLTGNERSFDVWKKWAIGRVSEFRQDHHYTNPDARSGPVKGYEAISWAMVDDVIYASGRKIKIRLPRFIEKNASDITMDEPRYAARQTDGLPRKSPPSAIPAWNAVIGKVTLIVPDFTQAVHAGMKQRMIHLKYDQTVDTPADIDAVTQIILEYAAAHKIFPSVKNPDLSIRQKAFWNEQQKWIMATQNMTLSQYIQNWTRKTAQAYRQQNGGQQPDDHSGPIAGFEKYTWKLLRECYYRDSSKPAFDQVISLDIYGRAVTGPITERPPALRHG